MPSSIANPGHATDGAASFPPGAETVFEDLTLGVYMYLVLATNTNSQ